MTESQVPPDVACVTAICGSTRVWLVHDRNRWLMFAGSRTAGGRRKDFASPFMEHAMRTAEHWYGAATNGWRAEESGKEKYAKTA